MYYSFQIKNLPNSSDVKAAYEDQMNEIFKHFEHYKLEFYIQAGTKYETFLISNSF